MVFSHFFHNNIYKNIGVQDDGKLGTNNEQSHVSLKIEDKKCFLMKNQMRLKSAKYKEHER